jgi:cytochrome c peroxidase
MKDDPIGRFLVLFFILCIVMSTAVFADDIHDWSEQEIAVLKSLSLASLPPLPRDPSNKYEDDPRAVALGRKFFFDNRFSGNLKVACATCHPENMNFADDLPLAHGMGTTSRRSMPLIGMAYNSWYFWDGRKDSLWSQALGPFESPVEHGFTRTLCAKIIIENYKKEYEDIFGALPAFKKRDLPASAKPSSDEPDALKAWIRMPNDKKMAVNRIYANMGKSIASFVRTIIPGESRFDAYVKAAEKNDKAAMKASLTTDEVRGLRLFIGKAKCTNCHNGPLFTNGEFHNIRAPQPAGLQPDNGRADAIIEVLSDEFNCLSIYSDAKRRECNELRFIDTDRDKYMAAFKTPTLRNVAERAPYMHAGQFATLLEVLTFYRDLKPEERPKDLEHGDLSDDELRYLEAFLKSLSSPLSYWDK